jgi:hypothetical protein
VSELSIHESGPHAFEQKSVGDLLRDLRDESTTLIEDQIALLKSEMAEKANATARDAKSIGTAAAVLHVSAFIILLAVSVFVSWWILSMGASALLAFALGPLIVGSITGLIGFMVMKRAASAMSNRSLKPEDTAQSLKETRVWVQNKV